MSNSRLLLIGGNFDESNGKPSKIFTILKEAIDHYFIHKRLFIWDCSMYNGGSLDIIRMVMNNIKEYKYIIWFPNISNDKEKVVKDIKKLNPECILVTSKRNIEKKYELKDIINHALGLKSNLVLEFIEKEKRIYGRILDPLGNIFCDFTDDFKKIGYTIMDRLFFLGSIVRVKSQSIDNSPIEVPNETKFFEVIKEKAAIFDKLIPTIDNTTRFLGNSSFRCQKGFPSFRSGDLVFVSKRNIDKKYIGKEGFVAVKLAPLSSSPVLFWGNEKPSVDTPVQLLLYDYYKNVNYIIHGHTYIKGKILFTKRFVPCGGIREFQEITEIIPKRNSYNFSINLIGHGCLILAKDIDYFNTLEFYSRPVPEIIVE